jgi:hypothetical protein
VSEAGLEHGLYNTFHSVTQFLRIAAHQWSWHLFCMSLCLVVLVLACKPLSQVPFVHFILCLCADPCLLSRAYGCTLYRLYGADCDLALYGMLRSVKRSSSLRERRAGSRSRNSERRKTCTPIVSPPPEPDSSLEDVDLGSVLQLDFESGESSTDPTPNPSHSLSSTTTTTSTSTTTPTLKNTPTPHSTPTPTASAGAGEEEEVGSKSPEHMTVYTYGQDTLPVKVGMVKHHKRGWIRTPHTHTNFTQGCG